MELQLSDDQALFVETTRRFLEDTVPLPTVRQLAEDEPTGFDRGWWRKGAELGWTSLLVGEEDGGGSISGSGLADLTLVAEEFGRLVSPGPLLPVSVVAAAVVAEGSSAQPTHCCRGSWRVRPWPRGRSPSPAGAGPPSTWPPRRGPTATGGSSRG